MYIKYPCKLLLPDFHTGQSLKSISELKVSKLCVYLILNIYEYIFIFESKGIVKHMIHREVSKYRAQALGIRPSKCTAGLTFLSLISSAVNQE